MSQVKAVYADETDYSDIEVEVLDEEGAQTAINNALELAGCDWEELQAQAKAGRFTNETAKLAWIVVSALV